MLFYSHFLNKGKNIAYLRSTLLQESSRNFYAKTLTSRINMCNYLIFIKLVSYIFIHLRGHIIVREIENRTREDINTYIVNIVESCKYSNRKRNAKHLYPEETNMQLC